MAIALSDDIDMSAVWCVIRRRLLKRLVLSLFAGAMTYGVLLVVSPSYESEAQLQIVAKGTSNPLTYPKQDSGTASDSTTVRMDKEAVNTHVRALLSPEFGAKVAAELKLIDRVEFNSELGAPDAISGILRFAGIGAPRAGESAQARVLSAYFKRLEVYSPKESRAINIRFTSIDPDLAAVVPNHLAEMYRAKLAPEIVVETDEVQQALESKINKLKIEVSEAEAAVEHFKGEANLFNGGQQQTGLNEQKLSELNAKISKAQAAKSEADARAKSAREMLKSGSADALPDVQKSPLIQNLVQQRNRLERQISELSATLLPGHPRMQQLNTDLAVFKRQFTAEVAEIGDSLEKEAKVAGLRQESLARSLAELKAQIAMTSFDEVKLRQLEKEARSKRSELERLQSQFGANRARADGRVVPVEVQIVTNARPSSVPAISKTSAIAGLMSFATFLLSLRLDRDDGAGSRRATN